MKIYGTLISGNCLKIKYLCDYLGLAYDWVEVDLTKRESHTVEFKNMNPVAEVPTLLLDDGKALAQSNAILIYLAEGSSLIPADKYERAKVNEWLFWEQYSHEPYVAVCRSQMLNLKGNWEGPREQWRADQGDKALDVMDHALKDTGWFVGGRLTLADIALLAYTRLSHEGGFDLSSRGNIVEWIKRCEEALGINES